ncbi:hypothetical protein R1flu_022765 [Riccia fluitans]|uniref:Uncharacterized protein n=1 Tax=Riccia fluitans TaxID=41844 RepID=A0ABD1XQT5_9MARC
MSDKQDQQEGGCGDVFRPEAIALGFDRSNILFDGKKLLIVVNRTMTDEDVRWSFSIRRGNLHSSGGRSEVEVGESNRQSLRGSENSNELLVKIFLDPAQRSYYRRGGNTRLREEQWLPDAGVLESVMDTKFSFKFIAVESRRGQQGWKRLETKADVNFCVVEVDSSNERKRWFQDRLCAKVQFTDRAAAGRDTTQRLSAHSIRKFDVSRGGQISEGTQQEKL